MHLADNFIQSNFHCIQGTLFFLSVSAFLGNQTHDLGFIVPCSVVWATEKPFRVIKHCEIKSEYSIDAVKSEKSHFWDIKLQFQVQDIKPFYEVTCKIYCKDINSDKSHKSYNWVRSRFAKYILQLWETKAYLWDCQLCDVKLLCEIRSSCNYEKLSRNC